MLEPREADIPALFLVLVVLPLVAYFLLGKWSEASKKRERISLLAQLAAEEALRTETMAATGVIPHVPSSKNGLHACARCFGPATTRCSKCKAVRYCSGKCQIIHWRQVHKQECLQLESSSSGSSPSISSFEESMQLSDNMNSQFSGYINQQAVIEKAPLDNINHFPITTGVFANGDCSTVDTSQVCALDRRSTDKRISRKANREMLRREDITIFDSCEETSRRATSLTPSNISSKEAFIRHKSRTSGFVVSEEGILKQHNANGSNMHIHGQNTSTAMHDSHKHQNPCGNKSEPKSNYEFSGPPSSAKGWTSAHEAEKAFILSSENFVNGENVLSGESIELDCSGMIAAKECTKARSSLHSPGPKISKSPKLAMKVSGEQLCPEMERKGQIQDELISGMSSGILAPGINGAASMGIVEMMGLKKLPKLARQDFSALCGDGRKKIKMLFPYEEFVNFFQCEVFDISPRGLLNCGNSCYANAVLQCLTYTKPLSIYLLHRSHSRACYGKDWCLMCELEQHVMLLRESGGPLSPTRILSHIRSINCQMGDGSQEDAHEFLRLLVASMQSICLERLGGEHKVDPRLQETTFIQHTFGGRLRSKVFIAILLCLTFTLSCHQNCCCASFYLSSICIFLKKFLTFLLPMYIQSPCDQVKCLRCFHESERYENIMDLTLEIFGWVESLEDALTQFTTPEDLDGENMYRCGRCAGYVRARKQLCIHEAPNILTIVLKRFQEGKYGKINKCITFPDMLDMVPFMTGMGDIPPLYKLYAVVVHLDTLNASFSGHYVSYVKDLRGNWFRIDDTEVHPVSMSQVMSEGAYILFYMRSCPRPQKTFTEKSIQKQVPARHLSSKMERPSRATQSKSNSHSVGHKLFPGFGPEIATGCVGRDTNGILRHSANGNVHPVVEMYADPISVEFSDVTSSDWSLFTSSDEASFTTESTRDSFSTVDYADASNGDPFSIFNNLYTPESSSSKTVSCRMFSTTRPHTRYVLEEKGYVFDSYSSAQPMNRVEENLKQVGDLVSEFSLDSDYGMFVKYGSNLKNTLDRTAHCEH
ncbi:ubiquitin carboxyl-terminal hydrolase 15-like isoform X2 [Durio zibethinus]|uniref:Ubiquitin carboxyl-terminal hydrolase 15-like isoform X2 n=1 Tax=Durio zibethinus TaxID=66656 RepID=A0A6P5Y1E5_DURZI|nr:ubiquitin carboxyl-terminal hydrolase 15-like isoform X2 [Durio zibethinus]